MIETVLSVVGVIAGWFSAWLIGYSVGKKESKTNRVNIVKLNDGGELHMWKGFVDPNLTFVVHRTGKNGEFFDGDGVVFDKNGHIIIVDRNVKEG